MESLPGMFHLEFFGETNKYDFGKNTLSEVRVAF